MAENKVLNDRYELMAPIGDGGMANVYRARDRMLERTVAIKILREDYSLNPAFRERFRQEAKAAGNLSHPNIVTVHDIGLDEGFLYIVMEYIPGTDLKTLLSRYGRFSITKAIPLMIQACAGIGYAHRAGLIHCDIKPHNILVTPDQRTKVTDFGIARALASINPDEKSEVVWGSPQYFSPEQAGGEAPSPASDVYSLGIVLYEMLVGRLPFGSPTASELSRMHREVLPTPPSKYNSQIPSELEQIILKVLAKEPAARYRTADHLGRVLVSFSKDQLSNAKETDTEVQAVSIPTKRHRPETVPSEAAKPDSPINIDWMTIALGLLTLLSVGGLIPFWIWVYYSINSPFQ